MREFINRLKPGAKALVIFDGLADHVGAGSKYLEALEALAARDDLEITLILPDGPAFEYLIKGGLGGVRQLGWRVVTKDLVSFWSCQLLVSDEGIYKGMSFEYNSAPAPYDPDNAHRLWSYYTTYCNLAAADAA